MARFRMGISGIAVHHYRYRRPDTIDQICPLCKEVLEDDFHFVLCCPVLSDLRSQYIPLKFYRFPVLLSANLMAMAFFE